MNQTINLFHNYQLTFIQMKWFPLRLDYIPIIDRQARSLGPIVANLKEDIENGDIIAVQKLSQLYTSIKKRIEKVEDFYNQHCMDQRVRYLYSSQIYLKSVISSFQGELDKYSAYCQAVSRSGHVETPWNNYSKNNTSKQKQKQLSKSKNKSSSNAVFFNEMNQASRKQKQLNLSKYSEKQKGMRQKVENPKHTVKQEFQQMPQNVMKEEKKLKTSRKIQSNIIRPKQSLSPIKKPLSPISAVSKTTSKKDHSKITSQQKMTENSRLESSASKGQVLNQQSQSSLKNLSQLVFTIKMTKQQYNSFMKLKKKDSKRF